jgi:hypothetical protein
MTKNITLLRLAMPALYCVVLALPGRAAAAIRTTQTDHVTVASEGISEAYAQAMARTVSSARAVAVARYGFNMPQTIFVSAKAGQKERAQLFNDGQDHIFLTVLSEETLRRPALTGVFHLYGLCHEIGHLAMYRDLPKRPWLSTAGAEGWAHFAGSRLLDAVYEREGETLWPDPYDYRQDGTARLNKELAAARTDPTAQAAGLWMRLAEIQGDRGLARLFVAWGQLQVDEANPAPALGRVLFALGNQPQLEKWWADAQPVLLETRSRSGFPEQVLAAGASLGP